MRKLVLSLSLLTMMTTALAQDAKRLSLSQLIPGNPDYLYAPSLLNTRWDEDGTFQYTHPDSAQTATALPKETQGLSADGLWKTVSKDGRLYVVSVEKEEQLEVSDNSEGDIVWGESVHRNEFGISGGLFWSPQGHRLAFYRMDETMVQAYPLVNTDAREAEVRWTKYPMAGMTSHQVTLGIYNPDTQKTVYLKTAGTGPGTKAAQGAPADLSDPEHYLTCITWRPDGRQIFVAELNRAQNYMQLNVYDTETGDFVQTLFCESHPKYVEPETPLYFLPGSNDKFVWQSERDGWKHLYLYDLSQATDRQGQPCTSADNPLKAKQLTQGTWVVTELIGADPKGKELFFMATKQSPLESHLYCVPAKGGKVKQLTAERGVHHVKLSPDYRQFYDVYSNHETPRVCQLVDIKKNKRERLFVAKNPFEGYARPQVEVGTLKADDDSTDLYYRLVKPIDFDATRQYPVVVYLYNGPHAQMVTEGFQYGLPGWDCHMAGLGYVVFTIDGRGSANRGLAFEQAIWHQLGTEEGKDQMRGIEFLKTLPWVDTNRIGIHGWSYGGFMTTYMMLNYPETFKVGVCGGPVLDWSRYEVMYGERYMGTPENNPEGYRKNCLIEQAGKLKGRLLIIHDDQDDVVVPQHSMQFLKNAVSNHTYPDFFMYPGHGHNVRGIDRVHLHEKITQYFETWLK